MVTSCHLAGKIVLQGPITSYTQILHQGINIPVLFSSAPIPTLLLSTPTTHTHRAEGVKRNSSGNGFCCKRAAQDWRQYKPINFPSRINKWRHKRVLYKMPFRIAQIRLVGSHPEVYEPCDDSFALVDALLADRINLVKHQPALCMEVGCGSGYVITSLALILGKESVGAQYIATDINPHAVKVTQETLEAHGVHAELISTNIASGLEQRLARMIDVMVVNPPYVPTPEDEVGCEGIVSAWAGGENGCSVIDKILPVADSLLSEKGWLYMVTLAANSPLQICLKMREKGYASRIVLQRSTEEESLHIIKFWRDTDV